jgi:predicted O-methyltransferase YrrM
MPLPPDEPRSSAAITAWVRTTSRAHDRFADVYDASEAHREQHGPDCTVYPSSNGPLLATLAAATGAKRILEAGCGLGYSALHLADGSSPAGVVYSIEKDELHVGLALQQIESHGLRGRITVHPGRAVDLLPQLTESFDLIFNDAELEEYEAMLDHFLRLLRPGGLLITSNLFLGQYTDDLPGIDQAIAYRRRLVEDPALRTAFTTSGLALSVRTP